MKNLQEPVWCNGLMLQAEHLQLFAGYTEQTMQLMMQGLGLGFWGVLDLSFNDSAVQLGLLQVEKLCLRLPASKFVFYSKKHATSQLSLQLTAPVVDVYLHCISQASTVSGSDVVDCYDYSFKQITDYFSATKSAELCVRKLRLRLSAERMLENSVACVKLARLERDVGSGYKFADYFPPCMRASVCPDFLCFRDTLLTAIASLLEVGGKAHSQMQRSLLIRHKCNLQFMNFELHPQSVWREFMSCYFEMAAAFGVEVDSSVPLDYSHATSYELLSGVYLGWLECLRGCRVEEITCTKSIFSDAVLRVSLSSWRDCGTDIYLRVRAASGAQKWLASLKILPEEKIIEAIRYSLPGLSLSAVEQTTEHLEYKICFDQVAAEILATQDLCVYSAMQDFPAECWDIFIKRDNLWKIENYN